MARFARYVLAVGAGLATASCTSLPDTSDYTKATVQVRNSVRLSGDLLEAELERGIAAIPADLRTPALATASKDFSAAWGATTGSLDALTRYAESIETLTKAGNSGATSGESFADSVLKLAGAAGLGPADAVGRLIVDTAGFIGDAVAKLRAARSVRQSMEAAEPIVQQSMIGIAAQTGTAERLFRASISEQRNGIDRKCDLVRNVERSLDELALQIGGQATVGASPDMEAKATRLRTGREAIAPHVADCDSAVAALDAREREGTALFAATSAAFEAWRSSHTRVVTAVQQRRPVSVQSLLTASEDLRALVTRWRDL